MIFEPVVRTFYKTRVPHAGDKYVSVGLVGIRDAFELLVGFEVRVFRGRYKGAGAKPKCYKFDTQAEAERAFEKHCEEAKHTGFNFL